MNAQQHALSVCKNRTEKEYVNGNRVLNAHYQHIKRSLPLLVFPKRAAALIARLKKNNISFCITVPASDDFSQSVLEFPQEVSE